jgi:cell division protein ZapA
MSTRQMEVSIMGQTYMLACHEGGEAALEKVVSRVDKEMCAIRNNGKVKARERIAVLAALNLAFALSDRSGPATGSFATHAETAQSDVDINALVERIDQLLGADGQLL